MAADVVVETRVDGAVKAEAEAVLKEIGMSLSDAVRMMLSQVARDKVLPLEMHRPNAETIAAMQEFERGEVVRFESVEALMADLHADD